MFRSLRTAATDCSNPLKGPAPQQRSPRPTPRPLAHPRRAAQSGRRMPRPIPDPMPNPIPAPQRVPQPRRREVRMREASLGMLRSGRKAASLLRPAAPAVRPQPPGAATAESLRRRGRSAPMRPEGPPARRGGGCSELTLQPCPHLLGGLHPRFAHAAPQFIRPIPVPFHSSCVSNHARSFRARSARARASCDEELFSLMPSMAAISRCGYPSMQKRLKTVR